jgi:SAM-dependent methyltransferase
MTFWRRWSKPEASQPPQAVDISERDTNADWGRISEQEPYWGVLTAPEYKRDNLTAESLEAFYASGRREIDATVAELRRFTGEPVQVRSALDFGCGVGRLAEAMLQHAQAVTGLDIAQPMLDIARRRGNAVRYVDALKDERFDWINSLIVFQHIPPKQGMELVRDLLAHLEPGGFISLHFTIWRDSHRVLPPGFMPSEGDMMMYDYDLTALVELLNRNGLERFSMVSLDHGGHHGVQIFGRRSALPVS